MKIYLPDIICIFDYIIYMSYYFIIELFYVILKISIINETYLYPIWHILFNYICIYFQIAERIKWENGNVKYFAEIIIRRILETSTAM